MRPARIERLGRERDERRTAEDTNKLGAEERWLCDVTKRSASPRATHEGKDEDHDWTHLGRTRSSRVETHQ